MDAASLYDTGYAEVYERLYLDPWPAKHATNLRLLQPLLPRQRQRDLRWVDLCCGQAWHFQQFPDVGRRIGIDLSPAQLQRAQRRNPEAVFACADVLAAPLPDGCADLVTCFWGAYCYLDDTHRIDTLLQRAIGWTAPGGALYFELLLPEALRSFNGCGFAGRTAFRVLPRSEDYGRWSYVDCGGTHRMTSPPLEAFAARLAPAFERIQVVQEGGFMSHLVATGRAARTSRG